MTIPVPWMLLYSVHLSYDDVSWVAGKPHFDSWNQLLVVAVLLASLYWLRPVVGSISLRDAKQKMLINLNVSYTSTILWCISKHITKSRLFLQKKHHKGWEATFLDRAFGFSKKLSTAVGFAFSNNGLKSQDLWFRMKKNFMLFLILVHDLNFALE